MLERFFFSTGFVGILVHSWGCRIGPLNYACAQRPLLRNAPLINKVLNPFAKHILNYGRGFAGLFLPRRCAGCDQGLMHFEDCICLATLEDLPRTRFHEDPTTKWNSSSGGKWRSPQPVPSSSSSEPAKCSTCSTD